MSMSILWAKTKSIHSPLLRKLWQNTPIPFLLIIPILMLCLLVWILPSKLLVLVQTLTLVVAIWAFYSHRRLSAAQLFRNRYDTFFASWAVEDEDVRQFKEKPHLFVENMDHSTYYTYKSDDNAIRNYLLIVQLYEYLAFAHTLNTSSEYLGKSLVWRYWDTSRIDQWWDIWFIAEWWKRVRKELEPESTDPYGSQWVDRWVNILVDDPHFLDVHKAYACDHPEFHQYLEDHPEFCRRYGQPQGNRTTDEIYQLDRWVLRDLRWRESTVQLEWTSEKTRSIKKQELLKLLEDSQRCQPSKGSR